MGKLVLAMVMTLVFGGIAGVGTYMASQSNTLRKYCKYNNAKLERINGAYYCVDFGNGTFKKIKWYYGK